MATSDYAFYEDNMVLLKPEFFLLLADRAKKYEETTKYFSTENVRSILDHIEAKELKDRCCMLESFVQDLFGKGFGSWDMNE